MTITSILMLGLSVFFSSTFSNLFRIQTQSANTERQFAVNEIIRDKFNTLEYLVEEDPGNEWILSFNQTTKGQLPFSYIGSIDIGEKYHLAFKDIMIFNKIFDTGTQHQYSSGGDGKIKNASGGVVTTFSNLKNFAGFAIKNGNYFVADTASDTIQTCPTGNLSTCSVTLDFSTLSGLSHPTDVATDGTNLYISDSGNNRIIKYNFGSPPASPPFSMPIANDDLGSNLNFPTGLTYYTGLSGNYLFVADTFNHKIKRIDLATFDIETIAGSGTDDTCGSTAKFCKLNLPTGVFADSTTHELYIADSGNNRILKISDPATDLSNFEIKFDLESATKISRIDFIFPIGSTLTNITESQANTLHRGWYELIGDVFTYHLESEIKQTNFEPMCTTQPPPDSCEETVNVVENFMIENIQNCFENNENILAGSDAYEVTFIEDPTNGDHSIHVKKELQNKIAYAPGTALKVDKTFQQGVDCNGQSCQFNFNLSDSSFPSGFQNITIEIYDENQQLVQESNIIMRMGDGELGTEEDVIEVVASGGNIKFPTGVSDQYFINSGKGEVWDHSPATVPGNVDIIDTTAFQATEVHSDFDYISDFTITSIYFSKHDPNQRILELEIVANIDDAVPPNTQTYKLNAILPAP